jgi:MOSC domain-containing protein
VSEPHLSAITVYPIKSAGGIPADSWELDDFGLRHDRRWAVINAAGEALTQRSHPRLALVRPSLTSDSLRIAAPGAGELDVAVGERTARRLPVKVWNDRCEAEPCGVEANQWWSNYLGEPCHMVRMPDSTWREVEASRATGSARVGFADAFPFLIISQAALDALNDRLEVPIPMNRFRPNLVIAAVPPHAEDTWDTVIVGDVEFAVAKACERCVVTTTDQETGIAGREPLRTLAQYRRQPGGGVAFGQNAIHRSRGTLRVGDAATPSLRH